MSLCQDDLGSRAKGGKITMTVDEQVNGYKDKNSSSFLDIMWT